MTRATLAEVLNPALRDGYALPGFVCLGWEDARAYVTAAETERAPVILQAGPGCRAHTPLPVVAAMLRYLADTANVPVVIHLDHGYTIDEIRQAIDEGFTSVMYDGSALPLADNIGQTSKVVRLAHASGVSCEGEIGVVGYAGGTASMLTDPEDAERFASETGVDAMAISVGNVHLQEHASAGLDETALDAIMASTGRRIPLVIHGGSGVPEEQRERLARTSSICKFNIGTELRRSFGAALRNVLRQNPEEFDRIKLLKATEAPLMEGARHILRSLGASGRAKG